MIAEEVELMQRPRQAAPAQPYQPAYAAPAPQPAPVPAQPYQPPLGQAPAAAAGQAADLYDADIPFD